MRSVSFALVICIVLFGVGIVAVKAGQETLPTTPEVAAGRQAAIAPGTYEGDDGVKSQISVIPVTAAAPSATQGDPVTPASHPILGDLRVRRAIAYCTDKAALLASVYPDLAEVQRQELIADTFIRPLSWAYTAPATVYSYQPDTGRGLLDAAGWRLEPDATYRTKNEKELVLPLSTTTASFRVTFLTAFEAQMRACGIRVIRQHLSADWFFGNSASTGLKVRDFEVAEFAWVMSNDDPGGNELAACNQVPSPATNWAGQNYTGWCNPAASAAIAQATDTSLSQTQRKTAYATVIDTLAAELPDLPLFWRYDAQAGGPSDVWEHIEFNLETYAQAIDALPAVQTVLVTKDYFGNVGSVIVPSGVVTRPTTFNYYPLAASAYPIPQGSAIARPFRLTAAVQGIPVSGLDLDAPMTVTVRYADGDLPAWAELALGLVWWDTNGGVWRPAIESCPEADRYQRIDRSENVVETHICHLSEFTLLGSRSSLHNRYLPLVLKNHSSPVPSYWASFPSPTTNRLTRVVMRNATDGWASGYNGTLLHYDGSQWRVVPSPTTAALWGLDVLGASEAWAVGSGGTIIHYDGTSWQQFASPVTSELDVVEMVSPTDGWAMGRSDILHFDGSQWRVAGSTGGYMVSIEILAPDDIWATGHQLIHYDGTSWSVVYTPSSDFVNGLAFLGPADGWAGGNKLYHYNGIVWQSQSSPISHAFGRFTVAGPGVIWGVGYGGHIAHFDATGWHEVASPTFNGLTGADFVSANEGWAVGEQGTILHYLAP